MSLMLFLELLARNPSIRTKETIAMLWRRGGKEGKGNKGEVGGKRKIE